MECWPFSASSPISFQPGNDVLAHKLHAVEFLWPRAMNLAEQEYRRLKMVSMVEATNGI